MGDCEAYLVPASILFAKRSIYVIIDGPQVAVKTAPPTGTVTFLFTDIEGSTRLSQQYPEAMPALLARHHQILREDIEAQNGADLEQRPRADDGTGSGVCSRGKHRISEDREDISITADMEVIKPLKRQAPFPAGKGGGIGQPSTTQTPDENTG